MKKNRNESFDSDINLRNNQNKHTIDKSRHEFYPRSSFLETYNLNEEEEKLLSHSNFKGFYNLTILCIIIFIVIKPIHNYLKYGYFIRIGLVMRIYEDWNILLTVFPLFYCWSYLALLLQILIKKEIIKNKVTILLFQHISQTGIFIATSVYCIFSKMCTTHMAFTVVQCLIHFFKMHSYTLVNRDLRKKYLESKEKTNKETDYPNNINFWNFFYFLRAPTFIYRPEYPRTKHFRWGYFFQKSVFALITLCCLYHIYTEHLEPLIHQINKLYFIELIFLSWFPLLLMCLLMFFLIFECILNAYAELATFADREFYKDWWNSTDFEEFNRKWNKVVHEFLYMHVFLEFYEYYGWSSLNSKLITFLFSAALHEFALVIVLKIIYPFMFLLMIAQLPVIYITKVYLKNTNFGNYFYWLSVNLGVCLIFLVYNKAYIDVHGYNW